jgi:Asp-tRNA(Asn)/Glu-tRNA(Gln) amidotransferase A subunit family amidase
MATTFGSVPYKDNVAARDATQTARLRAAGAIPMAKTNTPEWGASGITNNPLFGATRNPWDAERSPGGSSGGTAAAIASSMLPVATASDGGGSVRIPACWVGAFGLKTSFGRIPAGPGDLWDYPKIGVAGPLTKTVADAALLLDQVAGPSPYDPASLPHPGYRYADVVAQPLAGPLRIGVCVEWGSVPVQSDIAAAVEDGAKLFEKLGHDVRTLVLNPPDATEAWLSMSAFQHASRLGPKLDEHAAEWGEDYGQYVRTMTSLTAEQGGRMLRARNALVRWCAELFDEVDLLLTPTVAFDPPPATGPFPTEIEGRAADPLTVAAFVMPFNSTWNPAANVRSGISKAGFPMGMQIVGPQHRDDLVLQAAQAFEAERPWHPHWPEPRPVG